MTATELLNQIRSEVERLKDEHKEPTFWGDEFEAGVSVGARNTCDALLDFVNDFTFEPEGLDEAAKKEAGLNFDSELEGESFWHDVETFKAGAEWQTEQGVTIEGEVGIRGIEANGILDALLDTNFRFGDKVIVQIRKKEEAK